MNTPHIESFRNALGRLNLSVNEISEVDHQDPPEHGLPQPLRRDDGRLYITPTPRHLFELGPRPRNQETDLRSYLGGLANFR